MLHDKIKERDELSEICFRMENTIRNKSTDQKYQKEYMSILRSKKAVEKSIRDMFDEMRSGRQGNYYHCDEFVAEEMAISDTDEDGKFIMERVLTGIEPIDEQFLEGDGLMLEGVLTIGGDSNVGKSYFVYNMIYSFITQGYDVHFHSYEVSRKQLLSDLMIKRKIGDIVDDKEKMKKLTLDFLSYDIADLDNMIRCRSYEGTRIFMIDSYSKIHAQTDDEFRKMKILSDFFKKISMELGVLIVIIAQISKNDHQNNINDFSGGKALKYDSDYSFFISILDGEENTGNRMIYCEKNRDHEEFSKFGIVTGFNFETKRMHFISKLADYSPESVVLSDGSKSRVLKLGKKIKS